MMAERKTPGGKHAVKKFLGTRLDFLQGKFFFTKIFFTVHYYTNHYHLDVTSFILSGFAPVLILLVFHVFKVFNYSSKTFDNFPIKGGNT